MVLLAQQALGSGDTRTATAYVIKLNKILYPIRVQYSSFPDAKVYIGQLDNLMSQARPVVSEFQQKEIDKVVIKYLIFALY